ncbi:MAG: hypothetical protein HY026_10090 [Deltaproteobacteria bacterium]|nr:hypothetical protein [Deltaproteobacteria bacterium]
MRYLLESPHTKEECLRELDEVLAEGQNVLNKFNWGCVAGEHAGYAIVEADGESEVLNMVPSFLRKKARIIKVEKFTPEQIRSFH